MRFCRRTRTRFEALSGLLPRPATAVRFEGRDIGTLPAYDIVKLGIAKISRNEVIIVIHTNSGMRLIVKPGARMRKIVTMKLSAPEIDAMNDRLAAAKLIGVFRLQRPKRSWTVLKTWSIGSFSDSIGLDGFGAKACGGSQGFSILMIG